MATVGVPGTDRFNPQFAQLAKHYGVDVAICPPHRPQRKGVVEAAIQFMTAAGGAPPRVSMLRSAAVAGHVHARRSPTAGRGVGPPSASSAPQSRCSGLPALAFPAEITVTGSRPAARWCRSRATSTAFRPATPAAADRPGPVTDPQLRIVSAAGEIVATHRRAPQRRADDPHRGARRELEQAVLAAFTTQTDLPRKVNRPPGHERSPSSPSSTATSPETRSSPGRVAGRLRAARGGGG